MKELFELVGGTSKRKEQSFFRRLLFFIGDDPFKFKRAEKKLIRKEVDQQLGSSEPSINIKGIVFPKPGRVFRVKKGARYALTPAGSYVLVTRTDIMKDCFAEKDFINTVGVLLLDCEANTSDDRSYTVRVCDLEAASAEEIGVLLANRNNQKSGNEDPLFDGEAVELAEDVVYKAEGMNDAVSQKLSKGLRGVIDNPEMRRGANLDDINSPYDRKEKLVVTIQLSLLSGRKIHLLQNDRLNVYSARKGDRYQVYLPNFQTNITLGRAQLKRRSFDKDMFSRVVMDEKTRQDVLSLVLGKEEALLKWGIEKAFQKGRGKIFLAFGPSGTGKTMTGEALAELLERPLYVADSTRLVPSPESFEKALKDVIDKTERWNAVTIIDEAEGILQSRDTTFYDVSWRVQAVLRNLEKLKRGILWLTTNRPIDIDPSIDSRIRKKIYFPALDAEKRRKVWQYTFPKNLPIRGLNESFLNELAAIDINGREIRNAIMNAADQASYGGLDYVPAEFILAAAKTIYSNQEVLNEAKKGYRRGSKIGFLKDKP